MMTMNGAAHEKAPKGGIEQTWSDVGTVEALGG